MLSIFKIVNANLNNFFWCRCQNLLVIVLMFIFCDLIFLPIKASNEGQLFDNIIFERKKLQTESQKLEEPNVLKNPVLVGSLNTGDYARDVAVAGEYAYVANGKSGLSIVNVKNPAEPILISSLAIGGGQAFGVAVAGNYAYIADYDEGLKIIKIDNPVAPKLVGSLEVGDCTREVAVQEKFVYLAAGYKGLQVVNVTAPSLPVLVGSLVTENTAYGVAIMGSYTYISLYGIGLVIIDISTPSKPTVVGSMDIKTRGGGYEVKVLDDYAYIADMPGGLKIVNISDKTTPVLVGELHTEGDACGVDVVGNYAYVADYWNGLKIIDVSIPKEPFLFSSLVIGGCSNRVTVTGNHAYVADNSDGGLKIIRVKDHAPIVNDLYKSATTDTTITFSTKDFTDKYSDADDDKMTKIQIISLPSNGVLKLSKTAVTVDQEIDLEDLENITFEPKSKWHGRSSFNWKGFDGFEYSVDAANVNMLIDAPPVVSDISKSGPRDKTVTFSATDFTSKFTDADGDSLTKSKVTSLPNHGILKLSDTAVTVDQEIVVESLDNLTFEPESQWHGKSIFGWKGFDGFEYSSSGANVNMFIDTPPVVNDVYKSVTRDTTVIFNAKDFADKFTDVEGNSLTEVKITSLPSNGKLKLFGNDVEIGQEIVVADLDNLIFEPKFNWLGDTSFNWKGRHDGFEYSVDAADVNLSVVATVSPEIVGSTVEGGETEDVVVSGEYAYVIDRYNGLKVIDISSKSNPHVVGSLPIEGESYEIRVKGDYAYVVAFDRGLKIINISTPSSPNQVGHLDTDGLAYGVTVVDEQPYVYAYVADKSKGLKIVDVTNPSNPVLVSSFDTDGDARGIAVAGKYAYIADWNGGLKIIDMTDKTLPFLIGHLDAIYNAADVSVVGNYAYVADCDSGLKVVDVTDKANPVLISSLTIGGRAVEIRVIDGYAYIADGSGGMKIINVDTPQAPVKIGEQLTAGEASGVYALGNYAYLSDGKGGLKVIRFQSGAPLVGNVYKSGTENEAVGFIEEDFEESFHDANGEKLKEVKFVTLPNYGELKLAGDSVHVNKEINAGDLNSLTFNPEADWYGMTSFSWKGSDRFVYSEESADVRITLTAVKDSSGENHDVQENAQPFCERNWWLCYLTPSCIAAAGIIASVTASVTMYLHKKKMCCFGPSGYVPIN